MAEAGGRLNGLACIPTGDGMDVAVAELTRCAEGGHRGGLIDCYPTIPLHDAHYDPLWAAAQDLGMPLHWHRASGPKANIPRGFLTFGLRRGRAGGQCRGPLLLDRDSGDVHALPGRLPPLPRPALGDGGDRLRLAPLPHADLRRPVGPLRRLVQDGRRPQAERVQSASSFTAPSWTTRWAARCWTTSARTTSCGRPTTPTG